MAIEVEIKAHVADAAFLEQKLRAQFRYVTAFHKQDTYFQQAGVEEGTAFRLREEDGRSCVTSKDKKLCGEVEVNDECEFVVDDPSSFLKFVASLGYEPVIRKEKRGILFEVESGFSIELSHVTGLGDFVEIERLLADNTAAEQIEAARKQVMALLEELEISKEAIEARYYTDMLQNLHLLDG